MKSSVDYFFIWWLRTGRYKWSRLRRRLFERKYLNVALPIVESLDDIEACLGQVTWTMDGPLHLFDCISYPQTTWAKKKDDCDGFSCLAAYLLNGWNPNCNPVLATVLVRPIRSSHTVCVFTGSQGSLHYFDNNVLHREDYQTYEDVVAKITRCSHRLVCWDVRNPITLDMVEFHRS